MKNKNLQKASVLLLLGLILIGAVIWGIFTSTAKKELSRTLNETISEARTELRNYDDFIVNDRVKSLIRLLDKTKEINRSIAGENGFGQSQLDEYVSEQRLSGAFLTDAKGNIVLKSGANEDKLWKSISDKNYIEEIPEHSEETYTERITVDGSEYDLAVVSRRDEKGLVIAYLEKNTPALGDLTLESVFQNFSLGWNGVIAACKDDAVVSANKTEVLELSEQELQQYISDSHEENDNGIVCITVNHKKWCGQMEKSGEYVIYVFFPATQIYMMRSIVCGVYAAMMLFIYLIVLLLYGNVERITLRQSQKRLRIINALGTAYSSVVLLHLDNGETEIIKKAEDGISADGEKLLSDDNRGKYVKELLEPKCRREFLEFVETDTLNRRLKGQRSLTYTCKLTNGKWLFFIMVPQRLSEDGNITAVLMANRDVTAEKERELKQENELRDALAAAKDANKAKTKFLNSISHDIRTPMNAVIGYTALATTHVDNREMVTEYLKKIHISSQHLLSLINDVLDMSRIESGAVKLEEVKIHLPDIFHDLIAIIQGNIAAKQQDLYIDTQNIVHEDIVTDKLRLNQVLLNVISNAIKFTPTGGMINIRVCEEPCGREGYAKYSFSVRDNGIGMSEEFRKNVFDAFAREQTVTESGIQGTGLGLAISKNIINMMGGDITVNSAPGKGSEFIITLECRITEDAPQSKPIPELRGAKALVVDDNADTCMSVCKMLRDIEMDASWTTSGKEAVLKTKEACEMNKKFKAYIIDWQMPDISGVETVRRIRRVIGDDEPIIILTAYDWTEIADEAKEAGVTAFVSKPLFMSELREVLTGESKMPDEEPDSITRNKHIGKKILLVEDNELNREIAVILMEEAGFIVDSAEDGTDAVEKMNNASDTEYDLILMDIQMPKMDGYTATGKIRAMSNKKKANIPIVAMTANAFEEDKRKAFEAGMNGHIAKPISIDVILRTLDGIFDDSDSQK